MKKSRRRFRRAKAKKIRIGAAAEHSIVPDTFGKRKTVSVQTASSSSSVGEG